jgi:hypothetical protein
MSTYYFSLLSPSLYLPSEDSFIKYIKKESGDDAKIWIDKIENRLYVKCNKKPSDSFIWGIRWKEQLEN